jgi:hypothetical protein
MDADASIRLEVIRNPLKREPEYIAQASLRIEEEYRFTDLREAPNALVELREKVKNRLRGDRRHYAMPDDVRVVSPFTKVLPVQRETLERYGLQVEYIPMGADTDYWELLCRLWSDGRTFVVIEHDILPWPTAIEELASCEHQWCTFQYHIGEAYAPLYMLGCCKFGDVIMKALPNAWRDVSNRYWRGLDAQFCLEAMLKGYIPHLHQPPVIHLKV